MRWFNNISAFVKLMGAFGVLSLILAAVGALAVRQLGAVQASTDEIYKKHLLSLVMLNDIQDDVQRIRQYSYRMFVTADAGEAREDIETARSLDRSLVERLDRFQGQIADEEERLSFTRLREAAAEYRRHREERQYPPLLAGQKEVAYKAARDGAPKYEAVIKQLKRIVESPESGAIAPALRDFGSGLSLSPRHVAGPRSRRTYSRPGPWPDHRPLDRYPAAQDRHGAGGGGRR